MWQKMKLLFSPPVFEDADETQTARLLNGILWGIIGTLLILSPFLALSNISVNSQWLSIGINGFILFCLLGLVFILRRGYVQWISYILVGIIFVGMLPFYFVGDNLILLAIEHVALIAVAVLLLNVSGLTWLGIASVLVYSIGILAHLSGWIGTHTMTSAEFWNATIALFAMGTIIIINRFALQGLHQNILRTRRSEARARALLEAVPDLMFRVDQNGVFLDYQVNDDHTLLMPSEKFMGKSVREVLPMVADEAQNAIQKTLASTTVETMEYQLNLKDETRYFEARFVKSDLSEVTVIIRDMTEQKRAENLHKQQDARLQTYLNESPITIYFLDLATYTPTLFNRESFCGYTEEELSVPGSIKYAVHPDDLDVLNTHWNNILTGETVRSVANYRVKHKNGHWEWIEERKSVVASDEEGHPKEVLVMLSVITEHKQQENEIRQLNSELEKRVEARTAELAISNEALRQSEFRYQTVTELISEYAYSAYINPVGYPVHDWLTPSVEKVTGYSPTEFFTNGGWYAILHPDDRAHDESLYKILLQGHPISGEVRIITKSGAIRWVRTSARPEMDAEGKTVRLIGVVTDIHDRKNIELALRDSDTKLRTVFDLLPVGVAILSADKNVYSMNPALERILELDRIGLIEGQYIERQYFRADGAPMPEDEFASARALAEKRPIYDVETGIMKEDATLIWTNVSAAPLPDGGAVVVTSDITARKKAELHQNILYETLHRIGAYLTPAEVLTTAVNTISHLNDWMSVAISTPNPDGVTWTTRAGAGPMVGRFGKARSMEQGIIGRAFRTSKTQYVEDVLLDSDYFLGDGQTTQPRCELAVPIKNRERLLGVLNLESNVPNKFSTEELTLAESLADVIGLALDNAFLYVSLQNELAEREQAEIRLKALNAELARSNTDLERFAYAVSHDLQEPLRQVTQFSQLLSRMYHEKLDDDADEMIDFIVDGAGRMNTMVKGLLDYSRLGRSNQAFALLDINVVLERTLNNLKLTLEESSSQVTSETLPTAIGNEVLLSMLFQNLITNALKFRGVAAPHIHISAKQIVGSLGNSEWIVSVEDNGIGISPEYFDRIFVIFQRLHTREEYPGTGIGLALCKRIVELHGGRIWVESKEGEGSTFFFSLPAESKG